MTRTKGSKNRPKTNITKDYATQIAEKQETIASLNTEIASIQKAIEEQKNTLKDKKSALKTAQKELTSLERKKSIADAKAAEEAKKAEAEEVLKKLLASGMSADEILEKLKEEIQNKLEQCHDTGKDPNPMAQGMSWMKTNVKLAMDESDATIADLITDGCNMGVKSLSRYLNQYQAADEETKDIAKKLIKQEEELSIHMRSFL